MKTTIERISGHLRETTILQLNAYQCYCRRCFIDSQHKERRELGSGRYWRELESGKKMAGKSKAGKNGGNEQSGKIVREQAKRENRAGTSKAGKIGGNEQSGGK